MPHGPGGNLATLPTVPSGQRQEELLRADRAGDRRQRGHRSGNGTAGPHQARRRDHPRSQPGPPPRGRRRPAGTVSSTRCPSRSTTSWSPAQVRTTRRGQRSTFHRRAATLTPTSCCRCRSPGTPREGARRHAAAHQRYQWPPPERGRAHHGTHRQASRPDAKPRTQARAEPRQPDRSRIRRHTAVSDPARRPARRSPRAAAHHAADLASRPPRRHRGPRRPPHDQHGGHRRHPRHRRRSNSSRADAPGDGDGDSGQEPSPRPVLGARLRPPGLQESGRACCERQLRFHRVDQRLNFTFGGWVRAPAWAPTVRRCTRDVTARSGAKSNPDRRTFEGPVAAGRRSRRPHRNFAPGR